MDVALPTGEMEWEVQSELEWFTEDGACSESILFRVIPEEKKKIRLPCVVRRRSHPSSARFVRGEVRRTFSAQKNQQQPQRTFSNRALRWPISAATLTIESCDRKKRKKRRTSTRVPSYSIVSRSRAKKRKTFDD